MPGLTTFSSVAARGFKYSQGKAVVRDFANGTGTKTSGTTYTDSVTVQAGDLIIAACSWDPTASGAPSISAVTDTVSTPYTSLSTMLNAGATASGTGSLVQAWWGIVPSGVTSQAVTVTVTWGGTSVASKGFTAIAFSNVKKALVGTAASSIITAASGTVTTATANTGDLVLALVGSENNAAATGASDTTRGSWSAVVSGFSTGAGAATNQSITWQYKIVTGQGTQTASFSGLGGNSAIQAFVVKAA